MQLGATSLSSSVGTQRFNGVAGGKYTLINTVPVWKDWLAEAKRKRHLACDTETTGLSALTAHIVGASFSWGAANSVYIPVRHTRLVQVDNFDPTKPEWVEKFSIEKQLDEEMVFDGIRELFANPDLTTIWHNAKFDMHFYKKEGIYLAGLVHDTMLMHNLLNENEGHTLKGLSVQLIDKNADKWEKLVDAWRAKFARAHKKPKSQIHYGFLPLELMVPYAASDSHYTWALFKRFLPTIAADRYLKDLYIQIESKLLHVLFDMESRGACVDVEYLREQSPKMQKEMDELEIKIKTELGDSSININSNQQIIPLLQKKGVRLTKKSKKTQKPSLDKEVLTRLAPHHPVCQYIIDYRDLKKQKSTYADSLSEKADLDDKVHCSYNQNVSTGRMSGKDPNLMNIPGRSDVIRTAFVPPIRVHCDNCGWEDDRIRTVTECPNCTYEDQLIYDSDYFMLFADYSQIEVRMTGHYSQDPILLDVYNKTFEDIHTRTMCELFDISYEEAIKILEDHNHPDHKEMVMLRKVAKMTNFLIIYGGGPKNLAVQISSPERTYTEQECRRFINMYFKRFSGVKRWIDRAKKQALEDRKLQNHFGRYRRLPELHNGLRRMMQASEKWKVERALRQGVNYLIQGCKDADSKVLTTKGSIPLWRLYQMNSIGDYPALVSYTGLSDSYKVYHTGDRQVFQVETTHGTESVTEDHVFFAYDKKDFVPKRLKDLSEGNFVLAHGECVAGDFEAVPESVEPKHAELIGALCGDGSYTSPKMFDICFGNDMAWAAELQCLLRSCFNSDLHCPIRKSKGSIGNSWKICVTNIPIRQKLIEWGLECVSKESKKIPKWIFCAPIEYRIACLRGLFDSDGGLLGGRYPQFTNISFDLCSGFLELVHSLGFFARIVSYPGTERGKPHWRVTVVGEYSQDFLDLIEPRVAHKQKVSSVSRGTLPPALVMDIGNVILGSKSWNEVKEVQRNLTNPNQGSWKSRKHTYKAKRNFTRVEQSHICRMARAGSGSRESCLFFLGRIKSSATCKDKKEIDNLIDLASLNWAEIRSISDLGVKPTMDIEINGEDHSYTGHGLLQHNSCADLFKIAMIRVYTLLREHRSRLVMPIHDEIVMYMHKQEIKELLPSIVREMEDFDFRVPIVTDLAWTNKNWNKKQELLLS